MFRRIIGFAVFAVVALLVLKIAFALLGTLLGLAITVLVLAAMGFVLYTVLRIVSPAAAAKVREFIAGRPRPAM
jgi:hypothetical protein